MACEICPTEAPSKDPVPSDSPAEALQCLPPERTWAAKSSSLFWILRGLRSADENMRTPGSHPTGCRGLLGLGTRGPTGTHWLASSSSRLLLELCEALLVAISSFRNFRDSLISDFLRLTQQSLQKRNPNSLETRPKGPCSASPCHYRAAPRLRLYTVSIADHIQQISESIPHRRLLYDIRGPSP